MLVYCYILTLSVPIPFLGNIFRKVYKRRKVYKEQEEEKNAIEKHTPFLKFKDYKNENLNYWKLCVTPNDLMKFELSDKKQSINGETLGCIELNLFFC